MSIDRARGLEEAKESLQLAQSIKKSHTLGQKFIVGLEFSGDPIKSNFGEF